MSPPHSHRRLPRYRIGLAELEAILGTEAHQRRLAEKAAQKVAEERNIAFQLAQEIEDNLSQERTAWEGKIISLRSETAARSPAQVKSTNERAQKAVQKLGLNEADPQLIDAQLREAGWEADTEDMDYGAKTISSKSVPPYTGTKHLTEILDG